MKARKTTTTGSFNGTNIYNETQGKHKVKISFVDFCKAVALIVFALAELQPKYPPNAVSFLYFAPFRYLRRSFLGACQMDFRACVCVFLVNVF